MNKAKKLMEQLLESESLPTEEQYLAYRQRVSEGIRRAQREEKIMRIMTKSSWAVTGVVFLIGGIIDFNRDRFPDLVRLNFIVATVLCFSCAVAFLAFYLINYRPRLRNAEHEAMLLGLQRQLRELQRQLPEHPRRPPSAEGHETMPEA